MEYRLLGWPADGPTLDLDHRSFSYAGKFVMSGTGKLVACEDPTALERNDGGDEGEGTDALVEDETASIVGATAFDEDRTDASVLRIRYVTVRQDRQGEGIGTELLVRTRRAAVARGYDEVMIAVNNPFAYEAAHRAGFGYTGESTGIAELLMAAPRASEDRYDEGLGAFVERDIDLSPAERTFVEEKLSSHDG